MLLGSETMFQNLPNTTTRSSRAILGRLSKDIIELLEMDLDEILQDTSIARTGSGSLIRTSVCPAIDVRAALDVTDVIIRCGLLSCVPR